MVARILRESGLFTGSELNKSEDAWKLGDFSDRWVNVCLMHQAAEVERAMADDLAELLSDHCAARAPGQPWGWKEPRSIYLLPFFDRLLPALTFLHVVRDGRDMALSTNQNQLRKHGSAAPIPADGSEPVRSLALWSWVNLTAARYGEEHLGDRYLRIRFEDLCARPAEVASDVLGFLGLAADPSRALEIVSEPASLGRWRAESPALIAELDEQGGTALVELGYELSG